MKPLQGLFCVILVFIYLVLNNANADLITIPLSGGAEDGEYTTTVNVGTPPQKFVTKISTALSELLLPSPACIACKNQYKPEKSTTFQKVPCNSTCFCTKNATECGYLERFDGYAILGNVTTDIVQINGLKNVSGEFVRFRSFPPLGSTTDGVLGLSLWTPKYPGTHLLPQIENITNTKSFSMCLGEFGGALILGGYDPKYVGSDIKWVPLLEKNNFTMELTDIKIRDTSIKYSFTTPNSNLRATIDSGTQYLRLPSSTYNDVKALFQQVLCNVRHTGPIAASVCGSQTLFEGNCYILDDDTISQFPTLHLHFGNSTLAVPASNYLVDFGGLECLALERGNSSVVIGNRILQEYYTIFESDKVGFATAVNCSGAEHRVVIVSGNSQRGPVGSRLSTPLAVQVQRLNDSMPVEGINVTFNIVDTSVLGAETDLFMSTVILKDRLARVEKVVVLTDVNGTARTYMHLAGNIGVNMVTADTARALSHAIFVVTGTQSNTWRVITYMFLFGLVVLVVLLHFWHRKAMRRKSLYKSSSNINNSFINDGPFSPVQSPISSPSFVNFNPRQTSEGDIDEDDDEPITNYSWKRSFSFNLWRLKKRLKHLMKRST